ncbi:Xaa-Pro aminopeptidase [Malassezia caprae]|uniref:Exocyst complex component Sec8 n=1 Tax=Malassezia caprae TaxID=1381934 RepID=A0AAF0E985_9BASI|nr:Xaa-Pro aminopeptidase [Malassezia caprae]
MPGHNAFPHAPAGGAPVKAADGPSGVRLGATPATPAPLIPMGHAPPIPLPLDDPEPDVAPPMPAPAPPAPAPVAAAPVAAAPTPPIAPWPPATPVPPVSTPMAETSREHPAPAPTAPPKEAVMDRAPLPAQRASLSIDASASPLPSGGARDRLRPAMREPPVPVQAKRLGSLTQERALADARQQQKLRLLRQAERERRGAYVPHRMEPQASRSVHAYVDPNDEERFRVLHAVLRKLTNEWGFLLDAEFNPVRLSLALLPSGALHAHASEFASLASLIESSLQGTLDDHYDSFATAITVHHGMIAALGTSQDGIAATRRKLQSARDALGARRADFEQMWHRLESVKEAMRVLDHLEQLRSVPEELESLMTAKRFLEATQLLMRSLRMIQRADLAELGATADLRAYLRTQEHALLDILIEELQSHLYLKNYWCDTRWRAYVPGQDDLPDVVLGADTADTSAPSKLLSFLGAVRARIPYQDPERNNTEIRRADAADADASADVSEASREEDSFVYMSVLLESLSQLGKMGYALDTIAQLVPMELYQLVDATIEEVEARHEARASGPTAVRVEAVLLAPHATHSVLDDGHPRRSFSLRGAPPPRIHTSTELSALQRDTETMRDLFWTLFSKLEAVLCAHRAVQEVAGVIIARANPDDGHAADRASAETGAAALARVWDAVQHEVQALLVDYLAEDAERAPTAHAVVPLDTVLRAPRYERERNTLFRLRVPARPSGSIKAAADVVDAALHANVPGLVGQDAAQQAVLEPRTRGDEYLGTGHRRLVTPFTFTVSVLIPPTLAFVRRVAQVLPTDVASGGDFSVFLQAFVQERFLPLLGEQVQGLAQGLSHAPDAFHAEPGARVRAARPVVRSAVQLVSLVDSLYSMMQAAPFQRASYTRLVILAFLTFYEACNARYKALVAEDADVLGGPCMLSAVWVQRPEMYACLAAALEADPASVRAADCRHAEARNELRLAEAYEIRRSDLITSRKRFLALGALQHSLHWLGTHLEQFRVGDERDVRDGLPLPATPALASTWADVPRMYSTLAHTVLMTLRVELRLKTLQAMAQAMQGHYVTDVHNIEPDVHIVDLNTELAACHEMFKEAMLPEHHAYVFDGLDVLMDALLTQAVTRLPAINRFGVTKMLRNILSVQQNLKNIVDEPRRIDVERSKRLWELLAKEPEEWLAALPMPPPHTAAEYLAVVRLSLGLDEAKQVQPLAGTTQRPVPDGRFAACVDQLHRAWRADS